MVSFFAEFKFFRFWPKTMDYNKAFLPKLRCFSAVLLLHSGRLFSKRFLDPPKSKYGLISSANIIGLFDVIIIMQVQEELEETVHRPPNKLYSSDDVSLQASDQLQVWEEGLSLSLSLSF